METRQRIPGKQLAKFLFLSAIGAFSFVVPITYQGNVNTVVGVLTAWIEGLLSFCMDELLLALVAFSAIGSLVDFVLTKTGREPSGRFHRYLETSTVYLLSKLLALVFTALCYFGAGPVWITGPDVGGSMIGLGKTLISLSIALSYLLPFLTEAGLMEFSGEITRPVVRPLFKVPSDASLDLIASWMGASNAAVILSAEKYRKGYYTKREAACVMCNFSLVSIPFCMVIAETAGVGRYFPGMYGLLCILGMLLAMILPRMAPLKGLRDEYAASLAVDTTADGEKHFFRRAFLKGCTAAERFTIRDVVRSGSNVMFTILFNLLPTVIAWGILGMIVVKYTPVFQWISVPMGWVLNLMGVESAYAVAPATLAGFVDMFIPALLVTGVESARTRFVIATLSLIQIIYITEVGAVILQTKLGIDFKRLFLIFLERTLLSLPVIVLASRLIVP